MDTQQLSIDTLLTAARLLETHLAAAQHQTGQAQGLSFAASQLSPLPLPNTQSTVLLPAAVLAASSLPQQLHNSLVVASSSPLEYSIEQQPDFRDLVGKIRVAGSPKFCSSASTSAYPYNISPSPSRKSSASKNSRAAHNELEKTRRANLRGYLEKLKSLVPPIADASRNTTLALLTRARDHIKDLLAIKATLDARKNEAEIRRRQLLAELAALGGAPEQQPMTSEAVSVTSSRPESRCDSLSSARLSRDSPMIFLEYSPSNKPSAQSPRPAATMLIDPVAEGLLPAMPALPISFPRPAPTVFPSSIFDLICANANQATVH
ncbi:hypothetical protein WR25_13050 [Diploscapter pachys]|uniref:BHLH domain-containing protein n=1 Tax=Diploscapter pachys TaxID=2018661 RepID=A0A2A2JUB2_9BILA|nr:hypothetical protein WR25_13050 [Diploscapter pachys]